ncbi:MAG: hypothetical protein NZ526_02550 [Aquificaceae bacterium]|nr:hypothetical protein [Aquificaceae bacterium]
MVHYITDEFIRWIEKSSPENYRKLLDASKKAQLKRYGDETGLQSGTAFHFSSLADYEEFTSIVHQATLKWVNTDNNFGFPQIPESVNRNNNFFITESFYKWLYHNKPELHQEIENHIRENNVEIAHVGGVDTPNTRGFYLSFKTDESREIFNQIIHRATLHWLEWAGKKYEDGLLNIKA